MENTISYIVVTFVNLKSCILYLDFLFISLHFHPYLHLNDMKMASIFAVLSHSQPKLVSHFAQSHFFFIVPWPLPRVSFTLFLPFFIPSIQPTFSPSYIILLPSLLQLHLFPKRFKIPLKKGCKLSQRENQGRSWCIVQNSCSEILYTL